MVGTHPQRDHVGGLTWLLRHFNVKHYWGTGDGRDELFYRKLLQALAERGLTEQQAKEGQEILSSHDCRLMVLNPPDAAATREQQPGNRREGHLLNNRSIVTELTYGAHRMIFAADVEQDGLRRMQLTSRPEPVAVLKVPHHGAISSLNSEWITGLRPQHAVFSVGRHNPYGHPAPKVVDAYAGQGASIYRTDRDGGVWIAGKSSDSLLQVHRTREEKLQPTALSACLLDCEIANWRRVAGQWIHRRRLGLKHVPTQSGCTIGGDGRRK